MNEGSFKLAFVSSTKMKGIVKWGSGQSELTLTKKKILTLGHKNETLTA